MNEQNLVTRSCPVLLIYTIDMSGSTCEKLFYNGVISQKCEVISQLVNLNISEIIDKCVSGEEYRDYFHIVILGYNGDGVVSLLKQYCTKEREYVTITDLVMAKIDPVTYHSYMVIDGVTHEVTRSSRKYINITPFHTTPMRGALLEAYRIGFNWSKEMGPSSIPPIFINITDGDASDGSPEELLELSRRIKNISTDKGDALFVNIHINTSEGSETIVFPRDPKGLKDIKFANLLYEMSSELSEAISQMMSKETQTEWCEGDKLRAVSYNTSMSQLFNILQIGSLSI